MDKLLNVSEAAELLRLSPSTIRYWIFCRRIPNVKIGDRVLLRLSDLEALVQEGLRLKGPIRSSKKEKA